MQFALQASKSAPQSGAVKNVAHAVTMSSREIAELVGSRHDSVKRTIVRLATDTKPGIKATIRLPPLVGYLDGLGRPATEYVFSGEKGKRDSIVVVAQLSPEFTARLVDRWQELEQRLAAPRIPQTLSEALRLAADQAEQIERQQQALIAAEPKVRFYDNYADGTGLKGFRQVAKLIGAKEGEFREFLASRRIMYRLGGEWVAYADHINAGRFAVKTGLAENGHNYNAAKFTPKGVEWIAGLWAAHNLKKAMESAQQAQGSEV